MNMHLLTYSDEIRSGVLMIHGENAHSRYFSEDAFKRLKGDNKELLIIDSANHVDLYDNQAGGITYDKMGTFFGESMGTDPHEYCTAHTTNCSKTVMHRRPLSFSSYSQLGRTSSETLLCTAHV